jgi:hypothetical protein
MYHYILYTYIAYKCWDFVDSIYSVGKGVYTIGKWIVKPRNNYNQEHVAYVDWIWIDDDDMIEMVEMAKPAKSVSSSHTINHI